MTNKKLFLLSCLGVSLLLSSCVSNSLVGTGNENKPQTPSYDGGLQGDASDDEFIVEEDTDIETLFENAAKIQKYSYEVSVNVSKTQEEFTQYFTENAWYSEYGDDSDFGYAQTYSENNLFKFYINEEATEVYPSVYEYGGYYANEIIQGLYSPLTIANISMLESTLDSLSDDGYECLGNKSYLVTDVETMSVFQYMSTYGSSISDYIVALYVQIIDLDSLIFETTLDLGSYGSIKGLFTPQESTKIDFVNDAIINDGLKGINEHPMLLEASKKFDLNNFTLSGVTLIESNGYKNKPTSTIYCTNDYFVCDFVDENYSDFGFAFIKANTIIALYEETESGISNSYTEMSVAYDSCYEFKFTEEGEVRFIKFIGPQETETTKYLYVDSLPEVGDENTIYITKNSEGKMMAYEYSEGDNGYTWKEYYEWYDTVGDFYVFNAGATFYPSSNAFSALAPSLFETADHSDLNDNNFKTANSDITSALATGIFGWGFQPTTTWMSYITEAYMDVNLNINNEIESIDLGLGVMASVNGHFGVQRIYYNFSNFGSTMYASVDDALSSIYGD